MNLNDVLRGEIPTGILIEPLRGEGWIAALAFCDEHGEDGPDVLAANIETSRQANNAHETVYWISIGRRLIQMHLAGTRAFH